jgi:hypothetical protein
VRLFVVIVMALGLQVGCTKSKRTGGVPPVAGSDGGPSSAVPAAERCATDDDCVISSGYGCCGNPCGSSPPWHAVNRKVDAAGAERARIQCALEARECPTVNCVSMPACRTEPHAVCRAGRCAVHIELAGACKDVVCPAHCGDQPPPPKDDTTQCALRYEYGWAHCCCVGEADDGGADGGSRACETLLSWGACGYAATCVPPPELVGPGKPLPECAPFH